MLSNDFFHFGRLPLHLVSGLPDMHSNAILLVPFLYYHTVFCELFLRVLVSPMYIWLYSPQGTSQITLFCLVQKWAVSLLLERLSFFPCTHKSIVSTWALLFCSEWKTQSDNFVSNNLCSTLLNTKNDCTHFHSAKNVCRCYYLALAEFCSKILFSSINVQIYSYDLYLYMCITT